MSKASANTIVPQSLKRQTNTHTHTLLPQLTYSLRGTPDTDHPVASPEGQQQVRGSALECLPCFLYQCLTHPVLMLQCTQTLLNPMSSHNYSPTHTGNPAAAAGHDPSLLLHSQQQRQSNIIKDRIPHQTKHELAAAADSKEQQQQ